MAVAVQLRPMRREDVPRVMEIERECFAVPWHESAYLTEIGNRSAYYIVATLDEEPIGYAGMWIIMDEAHITTLGVARRFRRGRIGEQLLVGLIEEAKRRHARRATLECRRSNIAAQNLYYKFGFSAAAIRREYYSDNREDAIVMWVDDLEEEPFASTYAAVKKQLEIELGRAPAKETA